MASACDRDIGYEEALAAALIHQPRMGLIVTKIESDIENQIRNKKTIPANVCRLSASAIVVCGVCIGTDKLGHFVEEGLLYKNMADQTRKHSPKANPEAVARAMGYLLEGLDPITEGLTLSEHDQEALGADYFSPTATQADGFFSPDSFGRFTDLAMTIRDDSYGGPGRASLADIAANEAGAAWWKYPLSGVGCQYPPYFDICQHVTEAWDEGENPRKAPCNRPNWLKSRPR